MGQSQQSPIDLTNPIITEFGKDAFEIKWKKSAHGEIKRDEHGVRVEFGSDQRQFVVLNRKRYHLAQFHFHHPSEHWIDGEQQTMELHIVNQNARDGSRVVVGIFIDASESASTVPDLIPHLKSFHLGSLSVQSISALNPLHWLPTNTSAYYRYEGSLTTPEYDENVSWVILKDPLLLPIGELKELIEVFRHPARLPQPMNRRFLLSNFKPD